MKKQTLWEKIIGSLKPPLAKEERFEDWDWKNNDREFYEAFHKNANSSDP